MTKILSLAILLTIIMSSCGDRNEYWNLSKFNIDNKALKNDEKIKIIYTSQASVGEDIPRCYLHYVVVSQLTKDTINILSTANFELNKNDADKIFNFYDKDNDVSKIAMMDLTKMHSLNNSNINDEINNKLEEIKIVLRNPQFDYIADNNFPTIIGSFGISSDVKK